MLVAAYRLDGSLPAYAYVNTLLGLTAITTVPVPSFKMINGGRYGELQDDQRRTLWRASATVHEFIVTPYRADLLVEQNAQAALSLANYGYVLEVGSGARA